MKNYLGFHPPIPDMKAILLLLTNYCQLTFIVTTIIIHLSSRRSFVYGRSIQAHIFIYAGCSQEKYEPNSNSPFEASLNWFLSSVLISSPQALYDRFSQPSNGSSDSIYGLYQCRGDLKAMDCSRCISSAVNQIGLVCPYSFGASLQLEGCLVRYEHVDFLGKLDTSLRFKKCSKSTISDDVEFFRRRDDVLLDLEGALGFRVSSSGFVEGFAQCLGDLSPSDCSSCLADAVGKLKSLCGSAAAADVFLAQCYARYWASGYYNLPSDSSNEDNVGKTVAIIVGALAGMAILIVLLSICRKTMMQISIPRNPLKILLIEQLDHDDDNVL